MALLGKPTKGSNSGFFVEWGKVLVVGKGGLPVQ